LVNTETGRAVFKGKGEYRWISAVFTFAFFFDPTPQGHGGGKIEAR
jgi:hypothetical protein